MSFSKHFFLGALIGFSALALIARGDTLVSTVINTSGEITVDGNATLERLQTTRLSVDGGAQNAPIYAIRTGKATVNVGPFSGRGCDTDTITVSGVDTLREPAVALSPEEPFAEASSTLVFNGWVSASDTVTIQVCQIASQATQAFSGDVSVVVFDLFTQDDV